MLRPGSILALLAGVELFACNAVMGIDEAYVDPRLSEAGGSNEGNGGTGSDNESAGGTSGNGNDRDAGDSILDGATADVVGLESGSGQKSPCESYCDDITAQCTGNMAQYLDHQQCLAVCEQFSEGAVGATEGNSLACRRKYVGDARYAGGTERASYCRRAGPGGDGTCGTECEGYCALMMRVCDEESAGIYRFKSVESCLKACEDLPSGNVSYSTSKPEVYDGNHVECRLFHVTSATMLDPEEHCEHAMGVTLCEADDE